MNAEERISGYTKVQLMQVNTSLEKKKGEVTKTRGKVPVPEINSAVKKKMAEVRGIAMPSFDLDLPQKKEFPPIKHDEMILKEEMLFEDEMILDKSLPKPQPQEVVAKREEHFPKPSTEEFEFDPERFDKEVMEDVTTDDMDIEWLGKPRQIISKPAHPPTYPPDYKGQSEGKIRLQFWVNADGYVIRVRPTKILGPRLVQVATEHLRQYRFEPLKDNRGKGPQLGIIPFNFRLK